MEYSKSYLSSAMKSIKEKLQATSYEYTYQVPSIRHIAVSRNLKSISSPKVLFPSTCATHTYVDKIVLCIMLNNACPPVLYSDALAVVYEYCIGSTSSFPQMPEVEIVLCRDHSVVRVFRLCRWMGKEAFKQILMEHLCSSPPTDARRISLSDYIKGEMQTYKLSKKKPQQKNITLFATDDEVVYYPAGIFENTTFSDVAARMLRCVFFAESSDIDYIHTLEEVLSNAKIIKADVLYYTVLSESVLQHVPVMQVEKALGKSKAWGVVKTIGSI